LKAVFNISLDGFYLSLCVWVAYLCMADSRSARA
jgi:hypothetical protein